MLKNIVNVTTTTNKKMDKLLESGNNNTIDTSKQQVQINQNTKEIEKIRANIKWVVCAIIMLFIGAIGNLVIK